MVTRKVHDVHGYYALLGVNPFASSVTIKAAYRNAAKKYHPDQPGGNEEAFVRLNQAYRVLSDAEARAAYDALTAPPAEPEAPSHLTAAPVRCHRCHRVTLQPRRVILPWIQGRLWRVRQRSLTGVFCRPCANVMALRASYLTWIQGWWAPLGPFYSLWALWVGLWTGIRPREANASLLMDQARAFLAQGKGSLARACLEQAAPLAQGRAALEERLRDLERVVGPQESAGRLRDRWRGLNRLAWAQLLPVWLLLIAGLVTVPLWHGSVLTLLLPQEEATAPVAPDTPVTPRPRIRPRAPVTGIQHVATEALNLRQGPGVHFPVVAELPRFTTVMVWSPGTEEGWVELKTEDGTMGYAAAGFLESGSGAEARQAWCARQPVALLDNGTVLSQSEHGQNFLVVRNPHNADALVTLETPAGVPVARLFVAASSSPRIPGMPDGTFLVRYTTGRTFVPRCDGFVQPSPPRDVANPVNLYPDMRLGRPRPMTRVLTLTAETPDGPSPGEP